MTIDRHHYKYVHIHSSNHKSGNNFRIKVPHGLNACSRVPLQNFSIPNTIGNSYGPLSKLYWVEFMKDNATSGVGDWSKKMFYIDLSDIPSYTQNSQIADLIHAKFQNEVYDYDTGTIGTHQFGRKVLGGLLEKNSSSSKKTLAPALLQKEKHAFLSSFSKYDWTQSL